MTMVSFSLRETRPLRSLAVALILTLLLAGTLASSITHAADGTASFSLQPAVYNPNNPLTRSYFILNVAPGTTLNLRFRVTNVGAAAGSVNLYPVDATTGLTGGTAFRSQSAPRQDVGAWIS